MVCLLVLTCCGGAGSGMRGSSSLWGCACGTFFGPASQFMLIFILIFVLIFVLCRPRKYLAWVHQVARIERVLDRAHRVDRNRACFLDEKIDLVQAHAMLAGTRAVHSQ